MIYRLIVSAALVGTTAAWAPSAGTWRKTSTSVTMMNAAATATPTKPMAGKQAKINELKGRYTGRGDLLSMMEEADDEANYESFLAADEEEVDPPKNGQTITGTVIELDDNGALLEIGGKMSGYLPIKEASLVTVKHMNEVLKVGEEVTAEVIGTLKVTK